MEKIQSFVAARKKITTVRAVGVAENSPGSFASVIKDSRSDPY